MELVMDINAVKAVNGRQTLEAAIIKAADVIKTDGTISKAEFDQADANHDGELRGVELEIDPAMERFYYVRWENRGYAEQAEYILDLTDADLSGPEAVLKKANLQGALLIRTNFSGADLEEAEFSGTTVEGVKFNDSNLQGAWLAGINFNKGADFSGANLDGAHFSNSILMGADVTSAVITRKTDFLDARFKGVKGISWQEHPVYWFYANVWESKCSGGFY
jgi:hypothetical protein